MMHRSIARVIRPALARCYSSFPLGPSAGFHGLTDEQAALQEMTHRFCQAELAPCAQQIDKDDQFPTDMWRKLGDNGLLGITAPEEFGGTGLGYMEHVLAYEELARASGGVALSYGAHSNLCVNQIARNGTDEQRRRYLPKLCSGEYVGALAMSEPGAGSDVLGCMKTTARKEGGKYVLNGSKMWITNGPDADVVVVYARTGDSGGSRDYTAFIVETASTGFSRGQKLDKLGTRGSGTCPLFFDNVEVPAENVLGAEGDGARVLMSGLDYERVVLSAGPVGLMQAALDVVGEYVHEREQFGAKIGTFELMQGHLADMYGNTVMCRSFLHQTARACDNGTQTRKDAAAVILLLAEAATKVGSQAIQMLGGNGYINEYPTGRIWRDAKLYEIGAGTSEIRRYLIGREINSLYK